MQKDEEMVEDPRELIFRPAKETYQIAKTIWIRETPKENAEGHVPIDMEIVLHDNYIRDVQQCTKGLDVLLAETRKQVSHENSSVQIL